MDLAGQRRDRRPSRARRTPASATSTRRPGETVQTILAADLVAKVMGLRQITEFAEVGRCRGKELEHSRVSPSVHRPRQPDRAGRLRQRRGRHRLVHTAPGHGAEDYQTGRAYQLSVLSPVDESGRFTAEAPDWLTGQQVFAANPAIVDRLEGVGPPLPRAAARAQLSALLAVQEAGDLPGDRAVVHRGRPQRPARPDAQGDRRGPLASRLGPDADRGDGVAPPRLVHQPPAVVGRADPGPGLHDLPHPVAHGRDRPPFPRPVPHRRGRRLVHPAGRGTAAARRRLPAVRRDVVPQGRRHPRRLVRVGLEPSRRAGEGLRPGLSRLHVPGRLGPAPRLVPVVDPDGRRNHRRPRRSRPC